MTGPSPKPPTAAELEAHLYWYRASAVRVVDGDTVILDIDFGDHVHRDVRIRLLGINAPEMQGPTLLAARASRDYLTSLLFGLGDVGPASRPLLIHTVLDRTDKYGRLLATIYAKVNGEYLDVNASLVHGGYAVPAVY